MMEGNQIKQRIIERKKKKKPLSRKSGLSILKLVCAAEVCDTLRSWQGVGGGRRKRRSSMPAKQ